MCCDVDWQWARMVGASDRANNGLDQVVSMARAAEEGLARGAAGGVSREEVWSAEIRLMERSLRWRAKVQATETAAM
jgi:hypothetical protein